jgi:hypothetical protein
MPCTGTVRAGALQAWHPPHRQLHHAARRDAADDVHEVLDVDDGKYAHLGELPHGRLGILGSPAWLGGACELQASLLPRVVDGLPGVLRSNSGGHARGNLRSSGGSFPSGMPAQASRREDPSIDPPGACAGGASPGS